MEIEAPSLYSHQDSQLARLRESLAKHGASILCANPGVGKTRMSKAILAKFLLATQHRQMAECGRSGRAVFCVHRRSLVDNASNSFKEIPKLPHGIIMSKSPTDWSKQVSVGSIDTMLNKIADFYDDEVDDAVGNLTAMMEPLLMLFLGTTVGGLVIAMYLPIFQMGSAI